MAPRPGVIIGCLAGVGHTRNVAEWFGKFWTRSNGGMTAQPSANSSDVIADHISVEFWISHATLR